MNVNRQKKDHFEKSEDCFDVLARFEEPNNLIKPGDAAQFENAEQLNPWHLALLLDLLLVCSIDWIQRQELVERHRCCDVNDKSCFDIINSHGPVIFPFFAGVVIDEDCSEIDDDIHEEDEVNHPVYVLQ